MIGVFKDKRVWKKLEKFILKQNKTKLSSDCGGDPNGMLSVERVMTGIVNPEDGQRVRYGLAKEHSGNKSSTLILGCVCGETSPCNTYNPSPYESERLERLARLPWF